MSDTKREVKIQRLVDSYNITQEYALKLLTTDDYDLSLAELKMKYHNNDLGKLPEWCSEDALSKLLWKTIHTHYDGSFLEFQTKEDLYQDLQLFVRLRIHKIQNFAHLKTVVSNYLITQRWYNKRDKHKFVASLDQPINSRETDNNTTLKEFIPVYDSDILEEEDLLHTIEKIKNKDIRDLLVICGYILCDFEYLQNLYKDVYNSKSKGIQNKLRRLEERKFRIEHDNLEDSKTRHKSITSLDVVRALQLNKYEEFVLTNSNKYTKKVVRQTAKDALEEYKFYIKHTNILASDSLI